MNIRKNLRATLTAISMVTCPTQAQRRHPLAALPTLLSLALLMAPAVAAARSDYDVAKIIDGPQQYSPVSKRSSLGMGSLDEGN